MAFTASKPAGTDTLAASDDIIKDNFTHIVSSINNEHGWSDSTAASCTHDATLLKKFVGVVTRDMADATGAVNITSIGFTPQIVLLFAILSGPTSEFSISIGGYDGTNQGCVFGYENAAGEWVFSTDGDQAIKIWDTAAAKQDAVASGFSSSSGGMFTLTWTKSNLPTGIAQIFYVCLGFQS